MWTCHVDKAAGCTTVSSKINAKLIHCCFVLQDGVMRMKPATSSQLSKDAINQQTKESADQRLKTLLDTEVQLKQQLSSRLDQALDKANRSQALLATFHSLYYAVSTSYLFPDIPIPVSFN